METLFALRYLHDPRALLLLAERVARMPPDDPRRDVGPGTLLYLAEIFPRHAEQLLCSAPLPERRELVAVAGHNYCWYDPEQTIARDLLRIAEEDPDTEIQALVAKALEER